MIIRSVLPIIYDQLSHWSMIIRYLSQLLMISYPINQWLFDHLS